MTVGLFPYLRNVFLNSTENGKLISKEPPLLRKCRKCFDTPLNYDAMLKIKSFVSFMGQFSAYLIRCLQGKRYRYHSFFFKYPLLFICHSCVLLLRVVFTGRVFLAVDRGGNASITFICIFSGTADNSILANRTFSLYLNAGTFGRRIFPNNRLA